MNLDPLLKNSYEYDLPNHLIASYPLENKEAAKLLVYDRKSEKISHVTFKDLFEFIPAKTNILLNDTKVIKARIFGYKQTGAKLEFMLNAPLSNNTFSTYIRGRVRLGNEIIFKNNIKASIIEIQDSGLRIVKFFQNDKELSHEDVFKVLDEIGHIPLPPYIKREDTKGDISDYQSVFAKHNGAVAAPTASLHFNQSMMERLTSNYSYAFVTLHVGAGTFKPVDFENINDHIMHKEFYNISHDAKNIIDSESPILAVGTTVTRTIEYYIRTKKITGECDLFLHPLNKPERVNHLLTNFHLPASTLIMLVASFIGLEKTLEIYNVAIKENYRFFSYGDAMLIL